MQILRSICVNSSGFLKLLSIRLYKQMMRLQMDPSTKVMRHLGHLPTMKECSHILHAEFAKRSSALPTDVLFICLLPCSAQALPEPFDRRNALEFRQYCRTFLQQNFTFTLQQRYNKLFSCCRPSLSLDPILWVPMYPIERSSPRLCLCGIHKLTKQHIIRCLHMHLSLHQPLEMEDPTSCILNRLPHSII
ncbi:MAG: hypothetical protein EXX96DRAFT_594862 [Benjaminiella poitrasii]|nr:MAG: hypothetical protein EXX96DRAFT_594862 [Benjaminiella poitrasii]